jgi:hypothetical protein
MAVSLVVNKTEIVLYCAVCNCGAPSVCRLFVTLGVRLEKIHCAEDRPICFCNWTFHGAENKTSLCTVMYVSVLRELFVTVGDGSVAGCGISAALASCVTVSVVYML